VKDIQSPAKSEPALYDHLALKMFMEGKKKDKFGKSLKARFFFACAK